MEKVRSAPKIHNGKSFRKAKTNEKSKKKDFLKDICKEYSLKRNNFNPTDKSPNDFTKKLEIRMKMYYESFK
tara:strand:- start:231 stop:446 length:216 start_codon:yes stop_codon:yes gene_type:complete